MAVFTSSTPQQRNRRADAITITCVAVLATLFAWCARVAIRRILHDEFSDFRVFYTAAKAMLAGADPYAPGHRSYIYPPLLAFLYTPLARLPERAAAGIQLGLNIVFIAGSLVLAGREFLRRLAGPYAQPQASKMLGPEGITPSQVRSLTIAISALLSVLLLIDKVRGEIQMFQTNGLMLFCFTLALVWLDRWPAAAGVALGLAFNVKYLSLIALPYLLLRRRWMAAAAMVTSIVVFSFLPAVLNGWHANLAHLSVAYSGLAQMMGLKLGHQAAVINDVDAGFSLSITSMVYRFAREYHVEWSAAPIIAGIAAAVLIVVAAMYRLGRLPLLSWPAAKAQRAMPYQALIALEWTGLAAIALIFSPQTNNRQLVLLLLPAMLLWILALGPQPWSQLKILMLGLLLILVGSVYPFGGSQGWLANHSGGWYRFAGCSWCILVSFHLLLWAGLRYVRESKDPHPALSQSTGRGW